MMRSARGVSYQQKSIRWALDLPAKREKKKNIQEQEKRSTTTPEWGFGIEKRKKDSGRFLPSTASPLFASLSILKWIEGNKMRTARGEEKGKRSKTGWPMVEEG